MCGCLLCAHYWGPGLQPRHVPQTGNGTCDPLVHRPALKPLSHTNWGTSNNSRNQAEIPGNWTSRSIILQNSDFISLNTLDILLLKQNPRFKFILPTKNKNFFCFSKQNNFFLFRNGTSLVKQIFGIIHNPVALQCYILDSGKSKLCPMKTVNIESGGGSEDENLFAKQNY